MKFLVKDKKKDKKNLPKKYNTTEYDLQKQIKQEEYLSEGDEQSEYTRTVIEVFQNIQATGDPNWLKLLPENFLKR